MLSEDLKELLERLDSLTSEIEPKSEARDWAELYSAISEAEMLVPIGYKGAHVEFRDARRRLQTLQSKKCFNDQWKDERAEIRHIFYGRVETAFNAWQAEDEKGASE